MLYWIVVNKVAGNKKKGLKKDYFVTLFVLFSTRVRFPINAILPKEAQEMAQQIQEAKATYEELETRENIRIKVPKEGPYMTQIDGHTLKVKDQSLTVDSHWQNGMPPDQERKFLIQRNFFGFDRKELGGKHNATVKVTRKVTPGGWNVLLLDITKQDGRPTKTLKLRIGDDIPIELRPFHEAPVHLDFA